MTEDELQTITFAGGQFPIAVLLDKYRPYLKLLAARHIDRNVASRLSASDIVQQTQLEAFRDCRNFRGSTELQFVAWLKVILLNNVGQATRTHILARKRSVRREQSMVTEDRQTPYEPVGYEESPSAAAMLGESAVTLAQAMERLTGDQYEAIRLRYIEGLPLSEIAPRMDRSQSAVAGLLKRGLRELRSALRTD